MHTKYSSFLTYMQLQTIVTLTYYYYITSYFYILLLRSRLLSENSAPIFEFSSFIHTFCIAVPPITTPLLMYYYYIYILLCCKKKTPIQSQKTCFLICLLVYITTASKKAIHGLVQIMHYILEAMQCRQQNVDMISALNFQDCVVILVHNELIRFRAQQQQQRYFL